MTLEEAIDDLLEAVGLIPGEVYSDPVVALVSIKNRYEEIVDNLSGMLYDEVTQPVDMSDRPLHISELPSRQAFVIAGAKLLDDRYHNRIAYDAQIMIDADMRNWEYHTSNGNDNIDRVTTFWRNPDNDGEVCAVLWDGQIIP